MPSLEKILKIQLVLILCFAMPNLMMDIFAPKLHTITTMVLYITALFTMSYVVRQRQYKRIFIFYIIYFLIYSLVIYFDLTTGRKYSLDAMLGCPQSIGAFISTTLVILFFILQAPLYQKVKDFSFLVKWYIILNLPLVLLYIRTVGVAEIQFDESITDISTLTLSSAASNCLLLALIFKNTFTKSKLINKIILLVVFAATMYVWGSLAKRGAILWFFVSLAIYYIAKSKNIKITLFKVCAIAAIVYLSATFIINALEGIAPHLASRVESTLVEGHTSGRMEEDGAFAISIQQFKKYPMLGSYFRIVTSNPAWQGMYPHNIILEMLITFGIVGIAPFIYFLILIFIKIRESFMDKTIGNNATVKVAGIMFINVLFSLMSSGTLLLNLPFWICIAILLTANNKHNDKLLYNNTAQK